MRAAPQPAANAASSADPHLHRYSPADRGSEPRPCRPDPAFTYPLAGPVSRDTSNSTMPAQPSPRACTHVVSAPKWTYCHGKVCLQRALADAGGCGSAFTHLHGRERGRPLQYIAAATVDQLPRLVVAEARLLPSAHGLCSRSLCDNRSRRWQAPALGVLPGCSAQLIPR